MDIEPVTMTGEPGLIQQVWINLITNAIRYTEEGGTITVRAGQDKAGAHVTVADTGIGIAEEDIPHLFERFYKADKARTRTENSTGLGLAIAKKIIELHGGTIMVESRPGEGTQFDVYFGDSPPLR
jgi:signal transduction histidine kinase